MSRSVVHTAATPTRERVGHFDHHYPQRDVMNLRLPSCRTVAVGDVLKAGKDGPSFTVVSIGQGKRRRGAFKTLPFATGPITVGIMADHHVFPFSPGTRVYRGTSAND
ncbi:MAG: hypothetical protein HY341_01595 [Candidatus Kerfeldbacteria bacterium]|nr:hypothetical protein [Candidatus Kerfeldbacteria bacterium]